MWIYLPLYTLTYLFTMMKSLIYNLVHPQFLPMACKGVGSREIAPGHGIISYLPQTVANPF